MAFFVKEFFDVGELERLRTFFKSFDRDDNEELKHQELVSLIETLFPRQGRQDLGPNIPINLNIGKIYTYPGHISICVYIYVNSGSRLGVLMPCRKQI